MDSHNTDGWKMRNHETKLFVISCYGYSGSTVLIVDENAQMMWLKSFFECS